MKLKMAELVSMKMKYPLILTLHRFSRRSASKILARQPDLISKSRSDGHTALHIAALNGNMDVAKLLIKVRLFSIMHTQFVSPIKQNRLFSSPEPKTPGELIV